jgi:restriction system protein
MGRRSGIEGFMRAANRAMAAAERERARQQRSSAQMQRQNERRLRMTQAQLARELKQAEKQAKQDYLEMRVQEVADLNAEVEEKLADIRGVLAHTLDFDDTIAFADLYPTETFSPFVVPTELRPKPVPVREPEKAQTWWQKLLPGAGVRLQASIAEAESKFQQEFAAYQQAEERKRSAIATLRSAYDIKKLAFDASIAEQIGEIDRFKSAYFSREAEAFVSYNEMVLTRSEYPTDDFTQQFRIAYDPVAKMLAIEYDFPLLTVVPVEAEYKYVKTRDAIDSKLRKSSEIKLIYQQLLAEMSLRTIHEVFEADQAGGIDVLAFTGMVDTCDPATGLDIRVPVISVRATKSEFLQINLKRADPIPCLRSLGAHVSSRPDELLAVKPIVDFNMVDKRFVDQADALSDLESRPNLLDLSPTDFEVLVANLFGKMGLETKLTRSSRDGGVDAVAFDSRPVLGGKVVIQAKRYRDAVGVSAVRDLYGTMMNEGASKGILVTTGRYGPDAYGFAKDKPIELIDGSGLLYLLREQANVNARIVQV